MRGALLFGSKNLVRILTQRFCFCRWPGSRRSCRPGTHEDPVLCTLDIYLLLCIALLHILRYDLEARLDSTEVPPPPRRS